MSKILKSRIVANKFADYIVEKPPIPTRNFLIELSNMCNDKCIFCANRKMTRPKGRINSQLLSNILKQAYELGVREVGYYTTGEPFMHPDLALYVKWAKEIGFEYVYITTNGALCTPEKLLPVIEAGLDSIKFSINATDQESYYFIHGKDDFNQVIENLKFVYFFKQKLQRPFNVFVSFIATRLTPQNLQEPKKFFESMSDEVICLNAKNLAGLVPEITNLLSIENYGGVENVTRNELPCYLIFNSINVSYEGYLTACCTDFQNYLAYADLNQVSLQEAWQNTVITQLRKHHLEKNVAGTLCQNCIYDTVKKPQPLSGELCSDFDEEKMFSAQEAIQRIEAYKNIIQ